MTSKSLTFGAYKAGAAGGNAPTHGLSDVDRQAVNKAHAEGKAATGRS